MQYDETPRKLLKTAGLMAWLDVSPMWVKDHLEDPNFPVIDLAPHGSPRRTLRFSVEAVAAYLGIPVPPREAEAVRAAA